LIKKLIKNYFIELFKISLYIKKVNINNDRNNKIIIFRIFEIPFRALDGKTGGDSKLILNSTAGSKMQDYLRGREGRSNIGGSDR